jgi:hypothetical protein
MERVKPSASDLGASSVPHAGCAKLAAAASDGVAVLSIRGAVSFSAVDERVRAGDRCRRGDASVIALLGARQRTATRPNLVTAR